MLGPHLVEVLHKELVQACLALFLKSDPSAVDAIRRVDLSLVSYKRRAGNVGRLVFACEKFQVAVVIPEAHLLVIECPYMFARGRDPGRRVIYVARLHQGALHCPSRDMAGLARNPVKV